MKDYAVKALNGSLSGQVFFLKKKLLIGRNVGDIILKESGVSEPHGEIRRHSNDRIILQDLDSKNGIIVDGKRKVKTLLETGTVFSIGKTNFQLIALKSPEEIWLEFLDRQIQTVEDKPMGLKVFMRPIEVHCIEGPQKGVTFLLTYGPRFFGSASVDVPLLDSKVPDQAFQLIPEDGKVLFRTEYPEMCFREQPQGEGEALSEDEVIVCGETKLKVSFK